MSLIFLSALVEMHDVLVSWEPNCAHFLVISPWALLEKADIIIPTKAEEDELSQILDAFQDIKLSETHQKPLCCNYTQSSVLGVGILTNK